MSRIDQMDAFTRGYLEAALWSETDNDCEPLDDKFDMQDLSQECIIRADQDCCTFRRVGLGLLAEAERQGRDESHQGHDFWLTRNGHGVGFWDRGLGEVGKKLTEICHQFGEIHLMEGDDGELNYE